MKRLLLLVLVPAILASGCTARVLQYDASRPPLDEQTRIPIQPVFTDDYAPPNRFVYGEVAKNMRMPQEGTIELSNSLLARDQNENDQCDDSFANGARCTVCYLVCGPVALAAALVYLPYLIATGEMKNDHKEEPPSPAQLHARWLARVMEDRQWTSVLDAAYISGLSQALGWGEQAPPQQASFWSAPRQNNFFAYISKIVLSESSPGEYTLLLCGGSTIHLGWGTNPRTFETCQRGTIEVGESDDSPASGDALRAAVVERARQLSAAQAKELCPACAPGDDT